MLGSFESIQGINVWLSKKPYSSSCYTSTISTSSIKSKAGERLAFYSLIKLRTLSLKLLLIFIKPLGLKFLRRSSISFRSRYFYTSYSCVFGLGSKSPSFWIALLNSSAWCKSSTENVFYILIIINGRRNSVSQSSSSSSSWFFMGGSAFWVGLLLLGTDVIKKSVSIGKELIQNIMANM